MERAGLAVVMGLLLAGLGLLGAPWVLARAFKNLAHGA